MWWVIYDIQENWVFTFAVEQKSWEANSRLDNIFRPFYEN